MTRLLALVALAACGPRYEESSIGHMRLLSTDVRMQRDGHRALRVPVGVGASSFLATLQPTTPFVGHIRSLENSDGIQLYDAITETKSAFSSTNAGFLGPAASLNWPRHGRDAPLREGKWRLEIGVADTEGFYAQESARLDLLFKSDIDPTSGILRVALVFAGSTADDADLVEATREAVEHWRALYATAGIELDLTELEYPEGNLEPPGAGSDRHYLQIAEETGVGVINVVIVPAIVGVEDVYGIAGDIPGPLVPSIRTAVLVSAEEARGPDGRFDETELRIYGETLAHETGHLLGLFHPVETTLDVWDALDDTPQCSSNRSCESKMADNLMYPFPVCTLFTCVPQTTITDDQATAANLYVGVD